MTTTREQARARREVARSRALALAEPYRQAAAAPGADDLDRALAENADLILQLAETKAGGVTREQRDALVDERRAVSERLGREMAAELATMIQAGETDMNSPAVEALVQRYAARRDAAHAATWVWIEQNAEAAWNEACNELATLGRPVLADGGAARH